MPLLINVLFLPQLKLPNIQLRPLTMSSLKNMCFQNDMCSETTLEEFAIRFVPVISCEAVNVETAPNYRLNLMCKKILTILRSKTVFI